ncbi:sigma-70 family RNA polymerase sigma factor [Streptomyces sp. NPDC096132]|uniref:sigma-70 family RNA polymerase sigma factor n=1 Tax=Streptomyces sp. NPDC096132 TaxID=3366075 RepID=UPI00382CEC80
MSVDGRDEQVPSQGRRTRSPESGVPAQRERPDEGGLPPPRDLPAADADLIGRMRAGDDTAYEELYRRHADAVRRYARTCCRDAHTADDLTAEVFARMLQAVRGGSGPEYAVRAYLLTSVRRVAAGWTRSSKREQLVDDFAVFAAQASRSSEERDDTAAMGSFGAGLDVGADVRALHEAEQSMAMQAFRSLPERWQAVLWHTEVEDESPSEVAMLFGLDANGTRVLASRAREGLKQAYLQAHVSATLTSDEECAHYADQLGTYARRRLRTRAERGLRKHLEECARCRLAALQIEEVAGSIPAVVPVAVIGWFGAAGYAKALGLIASGAGAGAAGAAAVMGGGSSGAAGVAAGAGVAGAGAGVAGAGAGAAGTGAGVAGAGMAGGAAGGGSTGAAGAGAAASDASSSGAGAAGAVGGGSTGSAGVGGAVGGGSSGGAGAGGGAVVSEGLGAPVKAGIAAGVVAVAAAAVALALVGDESSAKQPVAAPPASAPVVRPQDPTPTPTRTTQSPEADPPAIVPAAAPTPTPTPTPAQRRTSAPTPTPTPTQPLPPAPGPTPPPTPTSTPSPTPPPAPVVYPLSELPFDVNGDGTGPEIRLGASSWVWQRYGLSIADRQYARGVTVHGRSSVTVDLNRACTSYDALVGVDDLTLKLGKVSFALYADGVRLWTSGAVKGGDPAVPVHVDLGGRETVRLVVEPHSHVDGVALADWAESKFTCS